MYCITQQWIRFMFTAGNVPLDDGSLVEPEATGTFCVRRVDPRPTLALSSRFITPADRLTATPCAAPITRDDGDRYQLVCNVNINYRLMAHLHCGRQTGVRARIQITFLQLAVRIGI